jgi:hypothetical protein
VTASSFCAGPAVRPVSVPSSAASVTTGGLADRSALFDGGDEPLVRPHDQRHVDVVIFEESAYLVRCRSEVVRLRAADHRIGNELPGAGVTGDAREHSYRERCH